MDQPQLSGALLLSKSYKCINKKLWAEGNKLFMSEEIFTNSVEGKGELLGILSLGSLTNLALLMLLIAGFKPEIWVESSDEDGSPPISFKR
jgi:hypothetical protein